MVLVFSARSNDSPHVKREVETGRVKWHPHPSLPQLEDVTPSSSLEFFIAGSHWLDALTPPLERHLERLAETVELLPFKGMSITSRQSGAGAAGKGACRAEPRAVSAGGRGQGTSAPRADGSARGGAPTALHGGNGGQTPTAVCARRRGHLRGHSRCFGRRSDAGRRRQ